MVRPPDAESVTLLLEAARSGDEEAFESLYARVYDELRGLAHVVRHGRAGDTLNTTALVNEAYLKLVPSRSLSWQDRNHFFRVVARAMRQIIADAAERARTAKRGGGAVAVTLNESLVSGEPQALQVVELDQAIESLEAVQPRQARVVELRFLVGLSVEETASVMDTSTATVARDWRVARAYLAQALA